MQQQNPQNDVPGMWLAPELEKGRQALDKMEQQLSGLHLYAHYLLQEYSPNVYMAFVAFPVLVGLAVLLGMLGKEALVYGWSQPNLFVAALGGTLLIGACGVAWMAFASTVKAFKHMNWFAIIVIVLFVGRMAYWFWGGSNVREFPWIDVAAAFAASSLSEIIYGAWRSRRGAAEDEWA